MLRTLNSQAKCGLLQLALGGFKVRAWKIVSPSSSPFTQLRHSIGSSNDLHEAKNVCGD